MPLHSISIVRSTHRFLTCLTLAGSLMGCQMLRETVYDERGVREVVEEEQIHGAKHVDLVFLLDPTRKRDTHDSLGNSGQAIKFSLDVDRAVAVFGHAENNQTANLVGIKQCVAAKAPVRKVTLTETETNVRTVEITLNPDGSEAGRSAKKPKTTTTRSFNRGPALVNSQICGPAQVMANRRNTILTRLREASDQACSDYLNALSQFESDIGFGSNLLASALGIAGGIATGPASILSASAGGVSGLSSGLTDSYLNGRSIGTIQKAIKSERIRIGTKLSTGTTKSISDYTIADGLNDAGSYHRACTLLTGLDVIDNVVEKDQQDAKTERADAPKS